MLSYNEALELTEIKNNMGIAWDEILYSCNRHSGCRDMKQSFRILSDIS